MNYRQFYHCHWHGCVLRYMFFTKRYLNKRERIERENNRELFRDCAVSDESKWWKTKPCKFFKTTVETTAVEAVCDHFPRKSRSSCDLYERTRPAFIRSIFAGRFSRGLHEEEHGTLIPSCALPPRLNRPLTPTRAQAAAVYLYSRAKFQLGKRRSK